MDTIALLDKLEEVYEGGGWLPGSYLRSSGESKCGSKGCLIGMSSFLEMKESGRKTVTGKNHMSRSTLSSHEGQKLCPTTRELILAFAEDPQVQDFYADAPLDEDDFGSYDEERQYRPPEYFNDHLSSKILIKRSESGLKPVDFEVADKLAYEEVLGMIRRTRARLLEFKTETPEPQEPETDDEDNEDQGEKEPVEALVTA